jgi:hypothetical protein
LEFDRHLFLLSTLLRFKMKYHQFGRSIQLPALATSATVPAVENAVLITASAAVLRQSGTVGRRLPSSSKLAPAARPATAGSVTGTGSRQPSSRQELNVSERTDDDSSPGFQSGAT